MAVLKYLDMEERELIRKARKPRHTEEQDQG